MVRSPNPLLWSKPSNVKAGVLLNLPEDMSRILGSWTDLDITSAGNHSLFIRPQEGGGEADSGWVAGPRANST